MQTLRRRLREEQEAREQTALQFRNCRLSVLLSVVSSSTPTTYTCTTTAPTKNILTTNTHSTETAGSQYYHPCYGISTRIPLGPLHQQLIFLLPTLSPCKTNKSLYALGMRRVVHIGSADHHWPGVPHLAGKEERGSVFMDQVQISYCTNSNLHNNLKSGPSRR